MYKLPYRATVASISHGESIEVDLVVEDAEGTNVHRHPFTTGARRSAAELTEIIQSHVSGVAKKHHADGLAETGAPEPGAKESEEDAATRIAAVLALKDQTFTGSVTR